MSLYQHCNLVNFAGHLSDRMKFSAGHDEILLVLSGRPALFTKTDDLS